MAELNLMHEELLEQEDMTIRDLPIELQRQVRGFNLQKKKFDENPSDNEGNRLTRISVDKITVPESLVLSHFKPSAHAQTIYANGAAHSKQ